MERKNSSFSNQVKAVVKNQVREVVKNQAKLAVKNNNYIISRHLY